MKTTSQAIVVQMPELRKIENSDSLSFCQIDGYNVVCRSADWLNISKAIFIPPENLVDVRKPEFSFLRKKDNRDWEKVKVVRLRGVISAGILIPALPTDNIGDDVTERLGIVHDDPEAKFENKDQVKPPTGQLSYLPKYDVDSFAKIYKYFKEDDEVVATEKVHGCLKWDSTLITDKGDVLIEDIVIGDKVLSYDIKKNKFEFVDVLDKIVQDIDENLDWYELRLDTGQILHCTENHLILTDKGYKKAKDLTNIDNIVSI